MPYIKGKYRVCLDPLLIALLKEIKALARQQAREIKQAAAGGDYISEPSEAEVLMAASGMFNYAITSLAVSLTGKPNYAKCALIRAVLADASDEFYRRLVAPYEDRKAEENGDVYPA